MQHEKETWEEQISFKDKTIDEVLEAIENIRDTTQANEAKINEKNDEIRVLCK